MKYDHEMCMRRMRMSIQDMFPYPYFLRSMSKARMLIDSGEYTYADISAVDGGGNLIYDMTYYLMLLKYHNVICFEL